MHPRCSKMYGRYIIIMLSLTYSATKSKKAFNSVQVIVKVTHYMDTYMNLLTLVLEY